MRTPEERRAAQKERRRAVRATAEPGRQRNVRWEQRAGVNVGDADADEVAAFLAAVRNCQDPAQLREFAESAGRELAPQELRRLYQQVEALGDAAIVGEFRSRAPGWQMFLRREPPVFDNTRISAHARLYAAAGVAPARKTLLVLFAGRGGGAFMPTARLLARLPVGQFDVLRLRADSDGDYPRGVPGFGDGFFAVCRNIAERAAPYGGSAAVGSSLGGFAALRAAILANLRVGISLSGRFTLLQPDENVLEAPAYDPLCACTPSPGPKLLAYYAQDHPVDPQHAERLTRMHPAAQTIPVAGAEDHNLLPQMTAVGGLDALFADIRAWSLRMPG